MEIKKHMIPERFQLHLPVDGSTLDNPLSAVLTWESSRYAGSYSVVVSSREDLSDPIISQTGIAKTYLKVILSPSNTYYWQVTAENEQGKRKAEGPFKFTIPAPKIDETTDNAKRYAGVHPGAHWLYLKIVPDDPSARLSPWYYKKSYRDSPVPSFEQIKDKLPEPVLEGSTNLIETYWYCWKTLFSKWMVEPSSPDSNLVSNIIGIKGWGEWGCTMVWDTAFILYFARYGHKAYPFIESLDNCYARQHENGFICRESDINNKEVFVIEPFNPPLFSWTEWLYYQISGDKERLRAVLAPIVKHYEWVQKYQRRDNFPIAARGLYWCDGSQEADDSPRNQVAHYLVSTTAQQALSALYLSYITLEVGRPDLTSYFQREHRTLGRLINENFWDEKHRIYNDLDRYGQLITEPFPGSLCKHCHIFWPLIAQVVPSKRVAGLVAELKNPNSFNRRNGIASLSADSLGYNKENGGQYWKGAVWPPIQCMVNYGLETNGEGELAKSLAEKYLKTVAELYQSEQTVHENLAPDISQGCGVRDFVGWGGIAPIAYLIEYILGFRVNAPRNQLVWKIFRTEKHGIKNLSLGGKNVSLLCQARSGTSDTCQISGETSGPFKLILESAGKTIQKDITSGRFDFTCKPYKGA